MITVVAAGHAWVQDLGRPGRAHTGVGCGGAADAWSARLANLLTGNAEDDALVEVTGSALELRTDRPLLVAVTGACDAIVVDSTVRAAGEPVVVHQSLLLPAPVRGIRTYLAVNGRLDVSRNLGAVAPDPLLGWGRVLRAGETVGVRSAFSGVRHPWLPLFRFGAAARPAAGPIEVTPGPDAAEFPYLGAELAARFEVSAASDHMGLRLIGTAPCRASEGELLSRGVPVGAVQVPPAGGVIVLLRARLLTAGYPIVAVATTESVDRLGQRAPGDPVRFSPVTVADALTGLRRRDDRLSELALQVVSAFDACGLGAVVSPRHRGRVRPRFSQGRRAGRRGSRPSG